MKTLRRRDLVRRLAKHEKWLNGLSSGEQLILEGYDLSGMDLKDLYMRGTIFKYCNFSRSDLRRSDLQSANLSYCNFRSADLTVANMLDCYMEYCDFRHATLTNVLLTSNEVMNEIRN